MPRAALPLRRLAALPICSGSRRVRGMLKEGREGRCGPERGGAGRVRARAAPRPLRRALFRVFRAVDSPTARRGRVPAR